MDFQLESFNPTVVELQTMVAESKQVLLVDPTSSKEVRLIAETRIKLKKARVLIEKKGKELRADALTFQRQVIEREKELIGIIAPEEDRLQMLEQDVELYNIKQERLRKLPERLEKLAALGQSVDDRAKDSICALDDVAFAGYLDNIMRLKLEAETAKIREEQAQKQAELDRRQAEIDAQERKIREKEDATLRELARAQELEKAALEGERRAKEEQVKKETEAQARALQDLEDAKAAALKLEKTKKFKSFLSTHGWTEETKGDFKIEETQTGHVLYRRLGEFLK